MLHSTPGLQPNAPAASLLPLLPPAHVAARWLQLFLPLPLLLLRRYLRATGGDQKHAAKRIHDTLEWRRAEQPEHIVCTACRANHKSHYMQVVGHDLTGRCAAAVGMQFWLTAMALSV